MKPEDRQPYVGSGASGCRLSADVDREEAETLDAANPRLEELLASAERWLDQAARWERLGLGRRSAR